MNTTDSTPDDSHWSSLAHELGLDETPTPPRHDPAADDASPPDIQLTGLPDAHDDEDTLVEPALSAEPFVESEEAASDEQTEDGGKRRRRRRRRRRKGGAGEPAAADGTAAEGEEPGEEGFAEEEEPAAEAPANAVMRDVVANWNVPSWDDLIAGLYRPGG
jgi:ribonuclease E